MEPKISVVIPVYNVEKYLPQCLDSIINQTLKELQIICVNDGSPDRSLSILREYASRDSRIEIIDNPHKGQSYARKSALTLIKGKYAYFVDADDWLELGLCEKVYQKAEETQADITQFLYYTYDPSRSVQNWHADKAQSISSQTKTALKEKLPLVELHSLWCKIFRTDFLFQNNIEFPAGLLHDDGYITWQAVVLAEKIAVVPEKLYHYRYTQGSITRSVSQKSIGDRMLHVIHIYNKIQAFLITSGNYESCREIFLAAKLGMWFNRYLITPQALKPKFVENVREVLTDDDRQFYRSAKSGQLRKLARLFYAMIDGGMADKIVFHMCWFLVNLRDTIRSWVC